MKLLRFVGGLLGILLLIVFIVVLPTTIWTFNLRQALFDEAFYERILASDAYYSPEAAALIMESTLTEALADAGTVGSASWYTEQFFHNVSTDADSVAPLLPLEWASSQLEDNLNTAFTWLGGPATRLDVYYDLAQFKQLLGGTEGRTAAEEGVASWPGCNNAQAQDLQAILDGSAPNTAELPRCQPEGEQRTELVETLQGSFEEVSLTLPDTYPSEEQRGSAISEQARIQLLNAKALIRMLDRVSYLIFLLPVVFLLLIQIAIVRSLKGFFGWYGWALLLGGILTLLLPLAILVLPASQLLLTNSALTAQQLQGSFILLSVLGEITRPILIQAGAVTVAGLAFVVIGALLPKRES